MESPLCPPTDPGFRLIETFRWTPEGGIIRAKRHLERLGRTAERFGITPRGVDEALKGLKGSRSLRVRLTLDASGLAAVASAPYVPLSKGMVWHVGVAGTRLSSANRWLQVKTTERALYDAARADLPKGLDELLFLNERDELCEGTISNLFVKIDGHILTPPLASGVLPGVLREELIQTGNATEAFLTLDSLQNAAALYMGNSLRGLIRAQLV